MAHAQKPDFVFRRNGQVHLNRPVGVSSVDYWQPRCAHQRDPARKLSAHLYDIYHCCVYSEKLLMMERGTVRNM